MEVSTSFSSEEELPNLSLLRSSRDVQKHIDRRMAELERDIRSEGNEENKIKSKRGRNIVLVQRRIA